MTFIGPPAPLEVCCAMVVPYARVARDAAITESRIFL
jgi:hypothetical protein